MTGWKPESFGALNAADYDERHDPGTTDEAVALLFELAQGARTLELAIGTGRVALPLAEKGLDISGIEASTEMVDILHRKPGGEDIPVAIGDMADVEIDGHFGFAFLIFNTLFNLISQDAQLRCFANVANHLDSGGAFLIEAFVPDVAQFRDGQNVKPVWFENDAAEIELSSHDPVNQLIDYRKIRFGPEGTRVIPLPMRYAWPAEIDLMAKLAGLDLEHRWSGWDRAPFAADSSMHISLYRKR